MFENKKKHEPLSLSLAHDNSLCAVSMSQVCAVLCANYLDLRHGLPFQFPIPFIPCGFVDYVGLNSPVFFPIPWVFGE